MGMYREPARAGPQVEWAAMTLAGARGTRTAGAARLAANGLRALWQDLNPAAGAPLAPLAGQRRPWLAWLPHLLAVALAVVLGTIAGGQAATAGDASVGVALTIGIAQGLPLVLALYRPMAGFWLSLVAGMLVSEVVRAGAAGSVWAEPSLLTHLGVLALVGLQARPRVLVELWLLTLAAGTILVQRMPGLNASPDLAEMTTLSAVVLLAAGALGGRREAQRRLAEQQRISDAERARRALLEERTRIARELHDVVAHHMSVIAIQAEAAPYRPPQEAARSFATIRATATEGLEELRRVVGVLRAEGAEDDPGPQPTLDRLDDLVATVEAAGLTVTVAVTGTPRPLPPGVELSAYRIVQEALSNAMRHAPGSDVRVELAYHPTRLELRVVNGPARAQPRHIPGAGHGIPGMRERAAMLGGELAAGLRPDGGYVVTAVLPVTQDKDR
jgi:signal transduction histidine kinase